MRSLEPCERCNEQPEVEPGYGRCLECIQRDEAEREADAWVKWAERMSSVFADDPPCRHGITGPCRTCATGGCNAP